jgi:hypothetical protein
MSNISAAALRTALMISAARFSWCLYKQGKYTQALELIRAFLEEKPEDKDGTHILSKILEKQQKKE